MSMEHFFRKHVHKTMAPTHSTLLLLIDEYPNSTQQFLSEVVGLQRSTMARTIDEFEKKGWAKRYKVEGDRRSLAIRLLPKGKKLIDRIAPKLFAIEEHVLKTLGRKRREELKKLLKEYQDCLWDY
ncbi:MAG: MarR family transcriptional regulator [Gammaproteobacteria bacterium]|nr:MarR family transcriptional regulator [Gammaproteobacteria bacterium]